MPDGGILGLSPTYTRHMILDKQYFIIHLNHLLFGGNFLAGVYSDEHDPGIKTEMYPYIIYKFSAGLCYRPNNQTPPNKNVRTPKATTSSGNFYFKNRQRGVYNY